MPDPVNLNRNWFAKHTRPNWERHLLPLAPFGRYLEIGCFTGDSLIWAAENLVGPDGMAVGVDPYSADGMRQDQAEMDSIFEHTRDKVYEASKRIGLSMWLERMPSHRLLLSQSATVTAVQWDMIFVDGDHNGPAALTDLVLSWRLLKPGGILVADDIHLAYNKRKRFQTRPIPHSGDAWNGFYLAFGHLTEPIYKTRRQVAVRKLA